MDYLLGTQASKRFSFQTTTFFRLNIKGNFVAKENNQDIFKVDIVQVILFEIDCAIFHINLQELFCQFIS